MTSLPESAAAERNGPHILAALRELIPPSARVLEIGSGWGQHAVQFCTAMPELDWQPSEQAGQLEVLAARARHAGLPGLRQPLALDVREGPWPAGPFDAAYSANTAHIMSWPAALAMLAGVSRSLAPGAPFLLYGPFNLGGEFTSDSNAAFDRDLKSRDPAMGIRDMEELEKAGVEHHLSLEARLPMPANNFLLVFRRRIRPADEAS